MTNETQTTRDEGRHELRLALRDAVREFATAHEKLSELWSEAQRIDSAAEGALATGCPIDKSFWKHKDEIEFWTNDVIARLNDLTGGSEVVVVSTARGRITPEQVAEAYRKTNLRPARETYFDGACACGLGAMVIAIDGDVGAEHLDAPDNDYVCDRLEISESYRLGFVNGFDYGHDPELLAKHVVYLPPEHRITEEFDLGIKDGTAAAAAVFPATA